MVRSGARENESRLTRRGMALSCPTSDSVSDVVANVLFRMTQALRKENIHVYLRRGRPVL